MDPWVLFVGLFVAALAVGVVEIFVPSGGLLAFLSAALFVGGIYYAFQISPAVGFGAVVAAPVTMLFVFVKGLKIFPRTTIGRLMILGSNADQKTISEGARGVEAQAQRLSGLLGTEGVTQTELRPSGTAVIGGRKYQVVSTGAYIAQSTPVRVIEVTGNRIVVDPIARDS